MRNAVEIENIEAMRLSEGIDDVELREEISRLEAGDLVKLTFLTVPPARRETLSVRITAIQGQTFWGMLTRRPVQAGLSELRAGAIVAFTAAHIHSLPKGGSPLEG
jgi:hypothetical protein